MALKLEEKHKRLHKNTKKYLSEMNFQKEFIKKKKTHQNQMSNKPPLYKKTETSNFAPWGPFLEISSATTS